VFSAFMAFALSAAGCGVSYMVADGGCTIGLTGYKCDNEDFKKCVAYARTNAHEQCAPK